MSRQIETIMALSVGLSLGGEVREVAPTPVRLQYSALPGRETPLPLDLRPTSLLERATGASVVGDLLTQRDTVAVTTARGSLAFVEAVAAAVPVDPEDERLVDALMARATAGVKSRPLVRKAGRGT